MTICASVKVRDGLVLGTDSMTQIWGQNVGGNRPIVKTYSNANKLVRIGALNLGIMTYGIGNLGPRSVQGLLRDFSPQAADVQGVTQELYQFFSVAYRERFGASQEAPLGFFVAGYSPGEPFADEWEFLLPRDQEIRQVRPLDDFGANWRGVEIPFTRLYHGFDPRMIDRLKQLGVGQDVIDQAVLQWPSPIIYDAMPVQDAVNFVVFILQTTIGMATFEVGPPSCGGPLQIAVVLPDKGFVWIAEPKLAV
jgi:hypothetical protein